MDITMSQGLIDVLDTAVKIGLGATITGVITYRVTRLTLNGELQKAYWTRRLDALDSATAKAEHFFHRWRRFASLVGAAVRSGSADFSSLPIHLQLELLKRNDGLIEASEDMYLVLARLRQFGAKDAADALTTIYDEVFVLRNLVVLDKKIPAEDVREDTRARIQSQIDFFHDAIGNHYQALGRDK